MADKLLRVETWNAVSDGCFGVLNAPQVLRVDDGSIAAPSRFC